jgi:hypothetical protein
MTDHRDSLFAQLEPPSGGVERFRRRLADAATQSAPFRRGPAAALVAIVLVASLSSFFYLRSAHRLALAPDRDIVTAPQFDRLLGRESKPLPLHVELNERVVQVEPVESSDPQVRIYQLR